MVKLNLEFLRPLIKYLPEVKLPKRHVPFKEKLIWSSVVLALFFIMGSVYPVKVSPTQLPPQYQQLAIIFASHIGTIISVGIGPIVTASIILQLLIGSKMIEIDLTKTENKALFQGTQKILTIVIAFFEAAAVVYGFGLSAQILEDGTRVFSHPLVEFTIFQIALGSILLMYMDEVVSKWGIGSGIGLFIAGGVSQEIISASFGILEWLNPKFVGGLGIIPNFISQVMQGNFNLLLISPIIATIIVFLIVVFGESMRLEIPLSYGSMRGVGGRYPLKFFYVSNIPVILTSALLLNVTIWARFAGVNLDNPVISEMNPFQRIVYQITFFMSLGNLHGILQPDKIMRLTDFSDILHSELLHLIIYLSVFILLCVLFGKFWVETTGIGATQVAEQIQRSGMQIPGFRRDKRIIEGVLNRYIPQITIISSVAVGLLAVVADLLGALGTGTGILLTVGILYRLYEEIQKEQMSEMHPAFRKFMGKI